MKSKYAVNWTQVIDAFRAAGALLVMQGLMFGFMAEAPQLISWAKGCIIVGVLFWAGWAIAVKLGVEQVHDQDMHNVSPPSSS